MIGITLEIDFSYTLIIATFQNVDDAWVEYDRLSALYPYRPYKIISL